MSLSFSLFFIERPNTKYILLFLSQINYAAFENTAFVNCDVMLGKWSTLLRPCEL